MNLNKVVRKAVIPAAGLGTRFLPATKAQPKEMLPIIDTPTIQYVVQEAVDCGITDIIIISGKGKRAIEDHFDRNFELEALLSQKNEIDMLEEIQKITQMAKIHYVRQTEMKGLADAIYQARLHTGNEPFAVLLGDTVIDSSEPALKQLLGIFQEYKAPVIGVEIVPDEKISKYGVVSGEQIGDQLIEVTSLIEKPKASEAPSNFAIAGRYILTPAIYKAIENTEPGFNNEIQLTDALKVLLAKEKIYACLLNGKRHDVGDKFDYIKTVIEFALRHEEYSNPLMEFMKQLVNERSNRD